MSSSASRYQSAQPPELMIDASLSLINRTGAHYLAEEICKSFSGHPRVYVRRWRALDYDLPATPLRLLFGRLMLRELSLGPTSGSFAWPEPKRRCRRVFLDPLYVLRSKVEADDLVLCHDIGPITHPELYDANTVRLYGLAYEKVVATRPGMVFVSEASRAEFVRRYGPSFLFARVISPLVRGNSDNGDVAPVEDITGPFLLTVGALEKRKNQVAAIRGFAESGLHARGYQYVLCGARGAGSDDIEALARVTPGVRVLGYVSDAQLRWLYRNAAAFILPSLLEGFGMPALEAARHGLIPILSRDSALTEAVNGLAYAVGPEAPAEIAAAMRAVVDLAPPERDSFRTRLIAHAASATQSRFLTQWGDLLSGELGWRSDR